MMQRASICLFLFMIVLLSGSPETPAFAAEDIPNANVTLVDALGQRSVGVYLGYGLILTSAQNITGEHYLWDITNRRSAPLAIQIEEYWQDRENPALQGYLCGNIGALSYQITPDPTTSCHAYNLASEMQISHPSSEEALTGADILYLHRNHDIAILQLDPLVIEGTFPTLQAARLNAYPLPEGIGVQRSDGGQVNILGNPSRQNLPAHGGFDGSQVQTFVHNVARLDERVAIGTPYYAEGQVVAMQWASGAYASYLNPVQRWYHHLLQVNQSLNSAALGTVLEDAIIPTTVAGRPTVDDPIAPQLGNSGYDTQHYELHLEIDPATRMLQGQVIIGARATYQNLASLSLDFASHMQARAVQVDGTSVLYDHQDNKLGIKLNAPLAFDEMFVIEITYEGFLEAIDTPFSNFFTVGLEYGDDPPRLAFANQPDGAHSWYPCNDHPTDRATYRFDLRVPFPYVAVANGVLVEEGQLDGLNHFVWEMKHPMASNLSIVAVADYVRLSQTASNGIPINNYVYAGTEEASSDTLSTFPDLMMLLSGWFGAYPFESYGHVITPLPDGAIETQTMVMMPDNTDRGTADSFLTLVAHELAHHWYGNTVTLRSWQDIWLNEGFATYTEWLVTAYYHGEERGQNIRENQERVISNSSRRTALAYPLPIETFGRESYVKGAWVLHMLRQELGDDVFFPMIQEWVLAYPDSTVTTLDFFRFVERFSGQDLTQFRRQWLYQPGVPQYELVWTQDEGVISIQACNLRGYPYRFPLEIVLLNGDGVVQTLQFDLSDDAVEQYMVDTPITSLVIDPNQQILGEFSTRYESDTSACLSILD